jgi:hypothetical protein
MPKKALLSAHADPMQVTTLNCFATDGSSGVSSLTAANTLNVYGRNLLLNVNPCVQLHVSAIKRRLIEIEQFFIEEACNLVL